MFFPGKVILFKSVPKVIKNAYYETKPQVKFSIVLDRFINTFGYIFKNYSNEKHLCIKIYVFIIV